MKLAFISVLLTAAFNAVIASQPFLPNKPKIVFCPLNRIPRGGAVHEPSTWDEVEALLIRASGEGKVVVIDFSATWCGPCKMMAPLFHELSEMETMQNALFIKIDVDENPETAARYSVSAMPTFVFIKEGNVVDRLLGANPVKLQEMLQDLL